VPRSLSPGEPAADAAEVPVRRIRRDWAVEMLLFSAAYALTEEGPIDQMLWNPTYGGFETLSP
jgi:hypothetical protein